ncbi:MAG TPA: MFS transporter [Methylomirabilota bacterium]
MPDPHRLHPAWIVLGALTLCLLASTGIRAVFGVYIKPMEAEFGWSRGALSGAAALSLLLLGAVGPFAGRLADRWGPRRVIVLSLTLLGLGSIASAFVQSLWHIYLTAGVLMAVGAGGAALSTGSTVVARWFESRRGVAMGLAAGGMSAGQLIVIPLATVLTLWFGWRWSFLWLGVGLLVLVVPIGAWLIRNLPEERGVRPLGATGPSQTAAQMAVARQAGRVSVSEAAQTAPFWLLMSTFFVCGYTSNGMVLTHFMPHALEHNFSAMEASAALGVMGAMNIVGTIGSGWLCDRFGRRGPLATYYFVRGVALLFLLYVWNVPSLHFWAALFGLNYISTVPPTTTLTANIYGRYSVGELSGWIFFAHQVGSALGAALAGWIYEWSGSYSPAFVSAAVMAFLATGLTMMIREEPISARPLQPAPATA